MIRPLLFWDVDTQYDFLHHKGKLYVHDAEKIIDNVSKIRRCALENGCSLIGTMDWHTKNDKEISDKPDLVNTFPPHCIADTKGAQRIGYTGEDIMPIEYIPTHEMDEEEFLELEVKDQFNMIIRKTEFDVFSNPNILNILNVLLPETIAIFGVTLDICVSHALNGLLEFCGADLIIIRDGVKGLGIRPDREIIRDYKVKGVKVMKLAKLKEKYLCV
jgi:nicotinamidase/pyrazinamidase